VETASTKEGNRCWATGIDIAHHYEGWTPSVVFSGSETEWCLPPLDHAPPEYLETRGTGIGNTFKDLLPASSVGALALQELDAELIGELRAQLEGTHLELVVGDASTRTDSLGFLYTARTMVLHRTEDYALRNIIDESETPRWQPRGALIAMFAADSLELTIANVHLKGGVLVSQSHAIRDIIAHLRQINAGAKASNRVTALCGDFNDKAPPDMRGYKRFSNGSVDSLYISQPHATRAHSIESHANESMSKNTTTTVSKYALQKLANEHVVPYGSPRLSDHAPLGVVIRPLLPHTSHGVRSRSRSKSASASSSEESEISRIKRQRLQRMRVREKLRQLKDGLHKARIGRRERGAVVLGKPV